MSKYIFLQDNRETTNDIFAISPDEIKTLPVSSTRGNYGQLIEHSDAGDYIEILSQKTIDAAIAAVKEDDEDSKESFEIGDFITAFDRSELFDAIRANKDLDEGVDYADNMETCKGFNYWDGHNWKSIITDSENFDTTHSIISDEQLTAELNAAIEAKEYVKEGFGKKIYRSGAWEIEDNYCEGEWASYRLREAEVTEVSE